MNPPSNYRRDVFSLNVAGRKTFVQGSRPAILDRKFFTPYPMTDSVQRKKNFGYDC